jgi:hypothetical protein
MITYANRASAVLYSFLKTHPLKGKILIPANVCPVVPLTMMKAGMDFEFVDIDERHTMSEAIAMEKVGKRDYEGLLFVHSYGKRFDNVEFYKSLKALNPNLCIIDDRCLCKPELDGMIANDVDMALYSTGYAKYVELSYGGYGVTNIPLANQEECDYSEEKETEQQVYIKECLKVSEQYNLPADYPWLDCSPLKKEPKEYFEIVKAKLDTVTAAKERINRIYKDNLPQEIQWGDDYCDWRFMISVENRDDVLKAIFDAGLFAGTNFPSVSWMFKSIHCDWAVKEASHIINLFNDFRVDEAFAYKTCEIINSRL